MPKPILQVRRAAARDAAALAHLSGVLGYPATVEQITERLPLIDRDPDQVLLVAEGDGRVAGWLHATEQIILEYGRRCEIVGLVVDAEVRGVGIGRALMEAAEAWAMERGLGTVSLRSNVVRTEAHAFYQHLGYRVIKTQLALRKELGSGAETAPA